jgi:hypothetical protein
LFAFGGVLAQLLLFAVANVLWRIKQHVGWIAPQAIVDLHEAFVVINLFIAALNLIPVRPFDGAEAWGLVPYLAKRGTRRYIRAR